MTIPPADTDYSTRCALAIAEIVNAALPGLPLSRQLLLCDGLSKVLVPWHGGAARAAEKAADALRTAEAAQMVFSDVLAKA